MGWWKTTEHPVLRFREPAGARARFVLKSFYNSVDERAPRGACVSFSCIYSPFPSFSSSSLFLFHVRAVRGSRPSLDLSLSLFLRDCTTPVRGGGIERREGSYCWIILDVLFCYRRVRVSGGSEDWLEI